MGKVLVQIGTGRKFLLDERIQKRFPDDYVLVEEKPKRKRASEGDAASANVGGDK